MPQEVSVTVKKGVETKSYEGVSVLFQWEFWFNQVYSYHGIYIFGVFYVIFSVCGNYSIDCVLILPGFKCFSLVHSPVIHSKS